MKLRIRDNSVRLRLTRGEVETVCTAGRVEGKTRFVDSRDFAYILESSGSSTVPSATFDGDAIRVRLPERAVRAWGESDQVSIRGEVALGDGAALSLLVEKDFACLAPRDGEDEADMYPHPGAAEDG